MNRLITSARWLAIVGVVSGLVSTVVAFAWAVIKTVAVGALLVRGETEGMAVRLVQIMDGLLIGAGMLIFSLGLHELFIGELALPEWLRFRDLIQLKSQLAGVIVMVMSVAFLEQVEAVGDSMRLLQMGGAVALVGGVLVWMGKKG